MALRSLVAAVVPLGLMCCKAIGCGAPVTVHEDPTARTRRTAIEGRVAQVDARFLSVAVDSAQLVGGRWWSPDARVEAGGGETEVPPYDFTDERLRRLAEPLAPGFLRLGGSEADKIFYDLTETATAPPAGYARILTRSQYDRAVGFAEDVGFDLFFTLNAGPGPRDAELRWRPDNARQLVEAAARRLDPIAVWELGNEINAFQVIHGVDFRVDGRRYGQDLQTARMLVDDVMPQADLAGPSSAYWPGVGEVFPLQEEALRAGGGALDLVTWHYYPQQSRRCPVASRPAGLDGVVDPATLDEIDRWADQVESARDAYAPGVPVWLGESGSAQCGGEPGVSDVFASGFWWMDQLGRVARRGQAVLVRQSLSGAHYGLLDDDLVPRPDYWVSVLHKRLVGRAVLGTSFIADRSARVYAHCANGRPGAVVVLVVNVDRDAGLLVALSDPPGETAEVYRFTAARIDQRGTRLNGTLLQLRSDGSLPDMKPVKEVLDDKTPELYLPAASYGFFVLPDARASACR